MTAGSLSTPHSLLERLQQSPPDPLTLPQGAERTRAEKEQKRLEADWARFAEFFVPALYQAAKKVCASEEEAGELAHTLFVEFRQGELAKYKRQSNVPFRRWLAVVLRHKWYEKKRGKKPQPADLEQAPHASDPVDEVIDREFAAHAARIALDTLLRRFPNGAVYAQHLKGEKNLTEVAQVLNKTMAAVYKEKSLILRQLRQDLDGLVND
jgi:DNA-directed RNA polymerase specialized sigma24 family protein